MRANSGSFLQIGHGTRRCPSGSKRKGAAPGNSAETVLRSANQALTPSAKQLPALLRRTNRKGGAEVPASFFPLVTT